MSSARSAALIACALGIFACSAPDVIIDYAPDDYLHSPDAITVENLEAHLAYLADDARAGRMTGEPGYDDAARYVADRFEEFGLEPGTPGGWFQPVPLISYRVDPESPEFVLHEDGGDTHFAYPDDFTARSDKVRTQSARTAEVVYVGFGVHAPDLGYSDYDGVDVSGRIVALFDGAPATFPHNERAYYSSSRSKAREAVRRGAVGAISLRSRLAQRRMGWERIKMLAGTRPSMTWVSADGRAANYFPELEVGAGISAATAARLFASAPISFEQALDAAEDARPASTPLGISVSISSRTVHERIESPNVVGIVRGTDATLDEEYVVYSAHLDHLGTGVPEDGDGIYNGAYDNAMGISLMLETARAMSMAPPRRSVLFLAVTGEERGLLGSDYYANYPSVPIDSVVANVNLDMPLFLYPVADVIAFGAEHSSLDAVVERAATAEGFTLTADPIPEETLFVRSDQYSFVRQGVPAIFLVPGFTSRDPGMDGQAAFSAFLKNHYHRPSDDLTQPVDWDSARRFARTNMRIGTAIGNADRRPHWNDGDFFGERFQRR